jgi:N-acetylglucosaminyldiphosphoundecaprenol N-acetyl-beta-D-mannosaminyltransferase
MRKIVLEWFFRVALEPKRLAHRYWTDICVVGPGLIKQLLKMGPRNEAPLQTTDSDSSVKPASFNGSHPSSPPVCVLPEHLDALSARDASLWPAEASHTLILDASRTTFLDSTGTGKLVRFARASREHGGRCILMGATPTVLSTLDLMKLRNLFTEAATIDEALAIAVK